MYKKEKRRALALLLILGILLIVVFMDKTKTYKDIDIKSIEKNIIDCASDKEKIVEGDNKSLKRFYGLNDKDYEEVIYYKPASNMDVGELLIIKVKEETQISDIEKRMNDRIENQKNSFKDYAPKQYSILKDSVVSLNGNYAFLAVSEDAEKMKEKFIGYIE